MQASRNQQLSDTERNMRIAAPYVKKLGKQVTLFAGAMNKMKPQSVEIEKYLSGRESAVAKNILDQAWGYIFAVN